MSLKDVAAKAGVTFPTVSKFLKGEGTVSPETRMATLQAAEELGCVPNAVARCLAKQKTSIIACIAGNFCDLALFLSTYWRTDDTLPMIPDDIFTGFVPMRHLITSGHTHITTNKQTWNSVLGILSARKQGYYFADPISAY